MTATLAPASAPLNALRFWSAGRDIFVEIPALTPGLPAHVIRFPYSPIGLAKALELLGLQRYDYGGEPMSKAPPPLPPPPSKNPILNSILKSRGIVP